MGWTDRLLVVVGTCSDMRKLGHLEGQVGEEAGWGGLGELAGGPAGDD